MALNRIQMFPFDIDESDIEDNPEQVIDDDSGARVKKRMEKK